MQIGILIYPIVIAASNIITVAAITIVSLFLNVELLCPVEIRIIPPQSS